MSVDYAILTGLARFRTMSVLTLTGSISVGNALLQAMPDKLPVNAEAAAKLLAEAVSEAEEGLTNRLETKGDLALERAFDLLVDRIWVLLRARLEFWHCYNHAGIALLSKEEQEEAEIDKNRKLAESAKELLDRLFGDGIEFLKMSYPQQAAHMAARLRYIDSRGLGDDFKELVGQAPAVLVRVCQKRYDAMVAERTARDSAVNVDLRPLRTKLAWCAENYASALIGSVPLKKKNKEEWLEIVIKALQPMLATDTTRSTGGSGDEDELPDGELGLDSDLGELELPGDDNEIEQPAAEETEQA